MLFPAKGLPPALIELDEAGDRIARYLERGDVSAETPSQIEAVLGKIPAQLLERDRADGELRVRTTDDGKMQFLSPVDEDDGDDNCGDDAGEGSTNSNPFRPPPTSPNGVLFPCLVQQRCSRPSMLNKVRRRCSYYTGLSRPPLRQPLAKMSEKSYG